jgi:membrane-bound serine protease (ClpP class)
VLLIGAEIFVPGAVVGTMGAISLVAAVVVAFGISGTVGFYVAVGVVAAVGVTVYLWIKFFPRSSLGQKLTLNENGKAFRVADDRSALVGKEGVAHSELRPAGFALIDNRRMDVVSDGAMIAKGEAVRVVRVEGNRIVVRKTP